MIALKMIADRIALDGVASLGVRPTVEDAGRILLETHVLDWPAELGREGGYGKLVRVELLHKLRDEARYDGLDALTAAIRQDVVNARLWFDGHAAERRQNLQSFEVLHRIQALQDIAEQERHRNDELNVHLQELRALNRRIRELGRTDHLTQLTNREHLFHEGERLAAASTPQRPLAAAIIDIDHFKRINDTWGHQLGDTVLQHAAQLIRSVARPGDVTARYGGEEFTILRPDATAADLAQTCQELQRRMHAHPWQDIIPDLRVTLSIGVADTAHSAPPGPPDFDALVGEADRRLYAAKNAGRDHIRAEA